MLPQAVEGRRWQVFFLPASAPKSDIQNIFSTRKLWSIWGIAKQPAGRWGPLFRHELNIHQEEATATPASVKEACVPRSLQ
jgi:hypothetical protein